MQETFDKHTEAATKLKEAAKAAEDAKREADAEKADEAADLAEEEVRNAFVLSLSTLHGCSSAAVLVTVSIICVHLHA